MTPLPVVPNVLKVRLGWKVGNDLNAGSAIHFAFTPPSGGGAGLTAFASAVATAYAGHLNTVTASDIILETVTVTDLSDAAALVGQANPGAPGGSGAFKQTAETAVLINFHIARRYRGGKPRAYMPLLTSGDLNDPQTWATSSVNNVQSGWNAFVAACSAFAGPPAVGGLVAVSYYHGGTWVANPVTGAYHFHPTLRATPLVDPILNSVVSHTPGSQRKRMLR